MPLFIFWDMAIEYVILFGILIYFFVKLFFLGKQVIHPSQIKVVQEEFAPSPERIKWATELIAAFEEHQKLGKVHIQ